MSVPHSITMRGISKSYGAVAALADIDLHIEKGEFFTLLGPSGSGKTTLLMVLAGFTRPETGSLKIGDVETIRLPPHKRNIGVVFQNYALFPHMNVAENIEYPLKLRNIPKGERVRRVDEALALVKLDGLGARRIGELSGGQRQRVALARAVVFSPQSLLMDEPLSALDKNLREHMQVELKRLHRALGMTTVYVTHDQGEAVAMSDRIAVMNGGRIIQIGSPREIYEHPKDRFVAGFIGESSLVPVQIRSGVAAIDGQQIKAAIPETIAGAAQALLVLRPERLQLMAAPDPMLNCVPVTVRETVYQGDRICLYVTLPSGAEVAVRQASHRQAWSEVPPTGAVVQLAFHPDDAIVVVDSV